jgi:hypothetical protein
VLEKFAEAVKKIATDARPLPELLDLARWRDPLFGVHTFVEGTVSR